MYYLYKLLLKHLYKFFIVKVSVLNKDRLMRYEKVEIIKTIDIETNKGIFTFIFKRDLRSKKRDKFITTYLQTYIIELKIPGGIIDINEIISSNIVLVTVNTMFVSPKINILAELLSDVYLDKILDCVRCRKNLVC